MADEHDPIVLGHVPPGFMVHLGHQRAGGIDDGQVGSVRCRRADRRGHAVRGQDHRGAIRDVVQLLHEARPLRLQVGHDVGVVDDLAPDVDGRAEAVEGALDYLDGSLHAGAERARTGQQDLVGAGGPGPALE
jgi:hypothetical protein